MLMHTSLDHHPRNFGQSSEKYFTLQPGWQKTEERGSAAPTKWAISYEVSNGPVVTSRTSFLAWKKYNKMSNQRDKKRVNLAYCK